MDCQSAEECLWPVARQVRPPRSDAVLGPAGCGAISHAPGACAHLPAGVQLVEAAAAETVRHSWQRWRIEACFRALGGLPDGAVGVSHGGTAVHGLRTEFPGRLRPAAPAVRARLAGADAPVGGPSWGTSRTASTISNRPPNPLARPRHVGQGGAGAPDSFGNRPAAGRGSRIRRPLVRPPEGQA